MVGRSVLMDIIFDVPGKPVGKARPRFSRISGRAYTPKETTDYEKLVKSCFLTTSNEVFFPEGMAVEVCIDSFYPIPASVSKKVRQKMLNDELWPTKKPDCDNVIKIICDALNGVAWHDDAQVINVTLNKHYAEEPHTVVHVWEKFPMIPF